MSLLAAGKSLSSATSSDTEILVIIKNRGGLWKVNSEVVQIFEVAEKYFRLSKEIQLSQTCQYPHERYQCSFELLNCTIVSCRESELRCSEPIGRPLDTLYSCTNFQLCQSEKREIHIYIYI